MQDTYNIGVKLFNEKPKKGIEYLLEKHVFTRDASAVAQWILSAPELDKVKIGEYIGEPCVPNCLSSASRLYRI